MGNLVMPKQSAVATEMEAVLKVYNDHDNWLTNEDFIPKLKEIIGDELEPQAYTKKTQIPAYFKFIMWEDITNSRSKRRITDSGKRFYQGLIDNNKEVIFRELIYSLEEHTFGRNVYGVSTDSDVEPPQVFIRSALILGYLTRKEFGYILWQLDEYNNNLFDVLTIVSKNRVIQDFTYTEHPAKYNDAKPITALVNWGFLKVAEEHTHGANRIEINSELFENYLDDLYKLKFFNNEEQEAVPDTDEDEHTGKKGSNIIYFGSPGTGKSNTVDALTKGSNVRKITFHPEYDYHSFVGGYKPSMKDEKIVYKFVPQIFTKIYIEAWQNPTEPYYLQIEEINRGNCAEIFGDLFQLLDRDSYGSSKYDVDASEELLAYLTEELGEGHDGIVNGKIKLPKNLSLIATMNTSDQSLFPMDSAFKRRWDWEYMKIDYDCTVSNFTVKLENGNTYEWLKFLEAVNKLIFETTGSPDKQIGNWFINATNTEGIINENTFINKVLFYLWNDVFKDEDESLFDIDGETKTYEDFFVKDKNSILITKMINEHLGLTNKTPEVVAEGTENGDTE